MKNIPKVVIVLDISRSFELGLLTGIERYFKQKGPWNVYRPEPYYARSGNFNTELEWISALKPSGIIMHEFEGAEDIFKLDQFVYPPLVTVTLRHQM